MATLLLFIVFVVLHSIVGQYVYIDQPMTWSAAQTFCREHHFDLATIISTAQNDVVPTMGYTGYAWIGLFDDETKWMWSNGNIPLTNTSYTSWDEANPNYYTSDASEKKVCVSETNGLWNDRNCGEAISRVCYEVPNIYSLERSPLSWGDSQADCRSMHKELTSVRDETEKTAVDNVSSKTIWIGLFRHAWVNWSDSTYSTFSNWDINMNANLNMTHDFHCAMIDTATGTWFRSSCDTQRSFICNTAQTDTANTAPGPGSETATVLAPGTISSTTAVLEPGIGPGTTTVLTPGTVSGTTAVLEPGIGPGTTTVLTPGTISGATTVLVPGATDGTTSGTTSNLTQGGTTGGATREITLPFLRRIKLSLKTDANLTDTEVARQILQQISAKVVKHGILDFKLRWTQKDGLIFEKEQKKKIKR